MVVSLPTLALAAPIELTAHAILGDDAPAPPGWYGYTVRVRGTGAGLVRGTVEITDERGAAPRAAFAVRPGDQAVLELYAHDVFSKSLEAIAKDENGDVLARTRVDTNRSETPLLFDAGGQNRLAVALKDEKIATHVSPHAWAPPEGLLMAVSRAQTDARSGEPILPERAMGYGAATVVVMRSEMLVGLAERNAAALADWLLTGGSLALVVGRTEDLAHPRLTHLIGAGVHQTASRRLAEKTEFDIVVDPTPTASEPTYGKVSVVPTAPAASHLVEYAGGTLKPTRYGASARVGFGTVHLLGFDPNAEAFVDDLWARRSMVELVRDAWDSRARVALVGSSSGFEENRLESARKHLDPNESGRWSVVVAAALLVVYAVVAGPLSFRRAQKSGNPLRALLELPLWSLGAVFLVVSIGAVSKGGRSRARRLTVVECASGAERCGALRLRAFFASSADALHVESTEPSALPEVVGVGRGVTRALVMEEGKARLEELRGRPWETVLVREDGFEDLHGSVTLKREGSEYVLTNGLPRALVAVIGVTAANVQVSFPRIEPGNSVQLSAGDIVSSSPTSVPAATIPGVVPPHRLEAYRFVGDLNKLSPGAGAAWDALENVSADSVDWWPDGMPVVLAEIEGGSGVTDDSGLRVDQDRKLIRVVGEPWEAKAP